jgi:hypothetical protein
MVRSVLMSLADLDGAFDTLGRILLSQANGRGGGGAFGAGGGTGAGFPSPLL